MRNMFGGRWISMMGIPPLTFLFIPLIFITMFVQRSKVAKRRRRLGPDAPEAIVGSWL
jgi:hypothetical protein